VPETMLTTAEAAEYCGLSRRTLEKRRGSGGGPRYLKLGRLVKYRVRDLEEWIARGGPWRISQPAGVHLASGPCRRPHAVLEAEVSLDRMTPRRRRRDGRR